MRAKSDIGDGDQCPIPVAGQAHGQMLVIPGTKTQYCPHQSHDGVWKDGVKGPMTRSRWPTQWFSRAVTEYNDQTAGEAAQRLPDLGSLTLPDIDMEAFNA